MSFKENLSNFFNNVNEKTTGWQDWLSGDTQGYKNFEESVNNFSSSIDQFSKEITSNLTYFNPVMSTATDWLSTYLEFSQFDTEIIDNYNKAKEVTKAIESGGASTSTTNNKPSTTSNSPTTSTTTENNETQQTNPTVAAIEKTENENIVNNMASSLVPSTTKSYRTIYDKFLPHIFGNSSQKENMRSLAGREQDFIGNLYQVFLYIEDENEGTRKGLSVRTKNLTLPTRQAETFKIDFMNRSIPKIDNSLNLNNTIDLTFTLDDKLVIFKELTNHSGITYMPISSTKENFYDTVATLQELGENKSELTSGFMLENSNLVLEINVLSSTHINNVNNIIKKFNESSSQNDNIKKLLKGYIHENTFKYRNLKIKSLGEINFDKNQGGPVTISLSALFNPKMVN